MLDKVCILMLSYKNMNYPTVIPITDLRRKFGEITADLASKEPIILTKGGSPFAILTSAPAEKRKKLLASAGVLKNTEFANPTFIKTMLTKKSRTSPIAL